MLTGESCPIGTRAKCDSSHAVQISGSGVCRALSLSQVPEMAELANLE